MSYTKIIIHAVWGTKSRKPYLKGEIRPLVIKHIIDNAKSKGIYIYEMNGYIDHLHCLFALDADMTISKVMQLIKGESAFWINNEKLTKRRFEWSDEYFAVSVSESMIPKVKEYILNQEKHHKTHTFLQEYEEFMRIYRFERQG
jgi:REP element-mobilizing transposase RayT